MRIGIIGAGSMGQILAGYLARLGHDVSISNSRGPESLTAVAAEIGARAVSVVDAVETSEIVFIAIPTKAVADLPPGLFAEVSEGVIVVDVSNYHPELRDGRIDAIEQGMPESQWVARQVGRPVVKAFNAILAESLFEKGVPKGTKGRIALPVAGDPPEARATVLRLVDDLGFDPVDGGLPGQLLAAADRNAGLLPRSRRRRATARAGRGGPRPARGIPRRTGGIPQEAYGSAGSQRLSAPRTGDGEVTPARRALPSEYPRRPGSPSARAG